MTQIKPILAGLILLFTTACSFTPEADSLGSDGQQPAASYTEETLSEEVLFELAAAAHAGSGAGHGEAVARLLEEARAQEDLSLLRQAAGMAWRMEEWQGLIEATQLWLDWEPGAEDARRLQVLAYMNAGQQNDAVASMQGWLEDQPGDLERLLRRDFVQVLAVAEDTDDGINVLDAVIRKSGVDSEGALALAARSRLLWETEKPEKAYALARRAAERSGTRDDLTWAAQLAASIEDYPAALEFYSRAREVSPDEWTLGLAQAQILRNLDRLDDALEVIEGLPENPDVLYSRASYLYERGDRDAAVAVWQQLADWAPVEDFDQHAFMVAWLAEFMAMNQQAAEWYAQVREGPQVDRAMIRRAVLLAEDDRLDEARSLLVLARDTEQPEQRERAYLVEAELLNEAGYAGEALALLTQALRETPNRAGLLYARAISAVESDDLELAEQDLRRIIRIDGENAMALNALGYTLTDLTSRHNEAYRLIRRALELAPEEPAILDSMGWVYFRLGRPAEALPYLERALAGDDNPEIAAHLAEVLWTLEQTDRAQDLLRETRARHPEDQHLIDVIERLEIAL
ncbi:MAG: tetratricopeptide repeat protein [Wenzhouxiangella sp.]|jgi:tetratricopeptide (TPR) repeat protein|nr:tetratricopeptide repeat protein [Wenzhouxiangella sp.]